MHIPLSIKIIKMKQRQIRMGLALVDEAMKGTKRDRFSREIRKSTPILAGDEVDPLPELDLEAAMAHEVLQSDSGDVAIKASSSISSPSSAARRTLSSNWDVHGGSGVSSVTPSVSWLPRFEELDTINMLLRQRIIFLGSQYDFSGRYDLVGFIKEVQAQGLYACLRIGPFIEAEWNYGG